METDPMTVERAPHYCQDGHAPVRFWRDTEPEELACPACDIASQLERAQGEGENLRARVAELERELAQWTLRCAEARSVAREWEVKCGELESENAKLRDALTALLPLADWALLEQSPPGADDALVDAARAALRKKVSAPRMRYPLAPIKVECAHGYPVAEIFDCRLCAAALAAQTKAPQPGEPGRNEG